MIVEATLSNTDQRMLHKPEKLRLVRNNLCGTLCQSRLSANVFSLVVPVVCDSYNARLLVQPAHTAAGFPATHSHSSLSNDTQTCIIAMATFRFNRTQCATPSIISKCECPHLARSPREAVVMCLSRTSQNTTCFGPNLKRPKEVLN
jgi:hypothetical protein